MGINLKNYSKYSMKIISLLVIGVLISTISGTTLYAQAVTMGFQMEYDPANWTFNANTGSGSFDASNAPDKIMITGNNDGQESINTVYTVPILCDGTIMFDWFYDGEPPFDDPDNPTGPEHDPSGFLLNGGLNQLTDDNGLEVQSGSAMTAVVGGDIFGFYIFSLDGIEGPGIFTMIDNFKGPSCFVGGSIVPIDTTALLLAGAQNIATWMIPVIVAGIGIAIVIARKF